MQETDAKAFERAMTRLCAGFNVPLTPARRDAYWRSFRKLSVLEFTGLIDVALVESTFAEMPTVGALWELHRRNTEIPVAAASSSSRHEPTIAEQLCEYTARKLNSRLTPLEYSMPWTYVYREWMENGKRCAECTGVVIDLQNGTKIGFSAEAMRADIEGSAQTLRAFRPGPKPTAAQTAAYKWKLGAEPPDPPVNGNPQENLL